LEFRANLSLKVLTDFLWYTTQFVTFEVLYQHTTQLGGWHVEQLRVFMGMLFMVDALYMIFFSENMDQLGTKVVKGELDFLLTKPIDSQFMASLIRINTPYCINFILVFCGFIWALTYLPVGVPWQRLPLLFVVLPAGVAVMYATKLVFATSALFFGANTSIMMVWYQLYRLGTRPDVIYPRWLRLVVLAVLPMGFIASVPARIFVEDWAPWLILASILVGCLMILFSRWFWRFALTRYSSASS
jgi:ABC-2 type transport system permease protein